MLNGLSIKNKLLASFLMVGMVPMVVVAILALTKSNGMLNHEIEAKFSAVQAAKTSALQNYFTQIGKGLKGLTAMEVGDDAGVEWEGSSQSDWEVHRSSGVGHHGAEG